jgi:hypothetical protein
MALISMRFRVRVLAITSSILSSPIYIDSLQLYASIHVRHFMYYRLLSKRFPFIIYYRVSGKIVRIYVILDCRQNPAWIEERLK